MEKIKRVPLAISGVMLGMAALGNLVQSYGEGIRLIFGGVAFVLLLLLLCKAIFFPQVIKEEFSNPIGAGVTATFPMSLMLFSVYAKPFLPVIAFPLWCVAILLQVLLFLYFSKCYVLHFEEKNVHTVWFITYVGIVVASLTSPAYQMQPLGQGIFYFGFIALLILLVVVTKRYATLPVPEPAKPLMMIYAAPMALCTAGDNQAFAEKNQSFLLFLLLATSILYLFALLKSISFLKLPFYPSYAAFTFPFVISAIATKQRVMVLGKMGMNLSFMQPVVLLETIIAAALTIYACLRFMEHIFLKKA